MIRQLFILFVSLSVFLFFAHFQCNDIQKESEGQITYAITYHELSGEMAEYEKMLPKQMTLSYKGTYTRTETKGGMAMSNQTAIYNSQTKVVTNLMDVMGKKIAVDFPLEDVEDSRDEEDFEIDHTGETKKIEGYTCKKAIVKDKEGREYLFYYAEDLNFLGQNPNAPYAKELPGVLMEYEVHQDQFKMRMVAENVEIKEIDEALFEIPEEYEKMTQEEFQQLMQGIQGSGR